MNDHPVILFVLVLANVMTALGFLTLGLYAIPRLQLVSRCARMAGVIFAIASAVTHIDAAGRVLAREEREPVHLGSSWVALIVQVALGISLWIFVFAIYMRLSDLKQDRGGLTPVVIKEEPS